MSFAAAVGKVRVWEGEGESTPKKNEKNDSAAFVSIFFYHICSKTVTDYFKCKYIPRLGATCEE